MIQMSLEDIALAVGGQLEPTAPGVRVTGLATDTRRIQPGDLFVALDGAQLRGSDFLDEAFRAGASAAICARPRPVSGPVIQVADANQALLSLAATIRDELPAVVIGITGSNGKTTTKDALAALLSARLDVVAAEGSYNNRVGLPLTIGRATERTEALVLEIGTSQPGEIKRLAEVARPDHVALTSIGASHLEGLGSIEGVLSEKLNLIDSLRAEGLVAVNADDAMLNRPLIADRVKAAKGRLLRCGTRSDADLRARGIDLGRDSLQFRVSPGGPMIRAAFGGRHNLTNLILVVGLALELGMTESDIAEVAHRMSPSRWRMELKERAGKTYLMDCYNANPASMMAALEHLKNIDHRGRKVVVLGDMLELGPASSAAHLALLAPLQELAPAQSILIGSEMRMLADLAAKAGLDVTTFADVALAQAEFDGLLEPGDLILVKGSRGMHLERIIGEAA